MALTVANRCPFVADAHESASDPQFAKLFQAQHRVKPDVGHADGPHVRIGTLPAAQIEIGEAGDLTQPLQPGVAEFVATDRQLLQVRERSSLSIPTSVIIADPDIHRFEGRDPRDVIECGVADFRAVHVLSASTSSIP
jgi:hypothetical protein